MMVTLDRETSVAALGRHDGVKRDRQLTHKSNIEAHRRNHCCSGKAIGIAYSECVSVALVIQHAMRMRHIVICGLSGCKIFFPHYLINDTNLEKKRLLNIKCVF